VWTIAAITFKEAYRRRILPVTVLAAVLYLSLLGFAVRMLSRQFELTMDPFKEVVFSQIFTMGLYFGSFIVSFLAVFAAVGTVSSEIENGTMLAVVPRPIRRWEIVLGKFVGFGTLLVAYAAGLFLALTVVIERIGGVDLPSQGAALVLFCFQPVILLAVTLCGTTFLSTMANGVVALALYAVTVVGGMIEQIGYLVQSTSLQITGIITSLIMPVDAIYRKTVYVLMTSQSENPLRAVMEMGPFGAQAEPSVWMLVYAGLYTAGALGLAMYLFSRRDI